MLSSFSLNFQDDEITVVIVPSIEPKAVLLLIIRRSTYFLAGQNGFFHLLSYIF
jgi:hypothetical protein